MSNDVSALILTVTSKTQVPSSNPPIYQFKQSSLIKPMVIKVMLVREHALHGAAESYTLQIGFAPF